MGNSIYSGGNIKSAFCGGNVKEIWQGTNKLFPSGGGGDPMPEGYEQVDYLEVKNVGRLNEIGYNQANSIPLIGDYIFKFHYASKCSDNSYRFCGIRGHSPIASEGYFNLSSIQSRIGFFSCNMRSTGSYQVGNYDFKPSFSSSYDGGLIDVECTAIKGKRVSFILNGVEYLADTNQKWSFPNTFVFEALFKAEPYVGGSRFYSVEVFDGETLKYKFLPAKRTSDGVAVIVETTTQRIFTQSNVGNFIAVKA